MSLAAVAIGDGSQSRMDMVQTSLRRRPAIDLDALDKALLGDGGAPGAADLRPAEPAAAPSDPLAELARLVHGDNPFKAVPPAAPRPRVHSIEAVDTPRLPQAGFEPGVFRPGTLVAAPPKAIAAEDAAVSKSLLDELERSLGAPPQTLRQPAAQSVAPASRAADTATVRLEAPYAAPPMTAAVVKQAEPEAPSIFAAQPEMPPPPQTGKSGARKGMVIAGCVAAAAIAGILGTMAMRGTGSPGASGPPVIVAKTGPAKERPANPGGTEVPNQNKQVLDKNSDTDAKAQSAVVSKIEQPVDLGQAVRPDAPPRVSVPSAAPPPAASASDAAPAAGGSDQAAPGQPRRVRAIPVTPAAEAVQPPPAPAPAIPAIAALPPPVALTPAAPPAPAIAAAPPAPRIVATPTPAPAAATPAPAPAAPSPAPPAPAIAATPPAPLPAPVPLPAPRIEAAPAAPPAAAVAPAPVSAPPPIAALAPPAPAAPDAAAAARSAAPAQPRRAQPAKPAENKNQARLSTRQPVTEEVTEDAPAALIAPARAARPPAAAPTSAPAPAPATTAPLTNSEPPTNSAGGGTYFAQLSSSSNEAEARASLARSQQRFGALGGQMRVVQGEANGATVYRVRVTGVSAEQAARICSQVRSSGGQCFNQRGQ